MITRVLVSLAVRLVSTITETTARQAARAGDGKVFDTSERGCRVVRTFRGLVVHEEKMKVRFGVSVLSGTAFPHRRDLDKLAELIRIIDGSGG